MVNISCFAGALLLACLLFQSVVPCSDRCSTGKLKEEYVGENRGTVELPRLLARAQQRPKREDRRGGRSYKSIQYDKHT